MYTSPSYKHRESGQKGKPPEAGTFSLPFFPLQEPSLSLPKRNHLVGKRSDLIRTYVLGTKQDSANKRGKKFTVQMGRQRYSAHKYLHNTVRSTTFRVPQKKKNRLGMVVHAFSTQR